MDLFTLNTQRFSKEKEYLFKLSGVFSSLSALVFEIVIASNQFWRLWDFEDNVVQFVSFGLWEAYYPQVFNISGTLIKMLVHNPIDSTWTISCEFQYAQKLIVWSIFMKLVVLVFSVIAFKISCMKDPFLKMQIYCFKFSAIVLGVSSFFTFVAVSWNHIVDLYGQTTLDFPPDFPVKKEALRSKHVTAVFPVGVLTTTMSLFGVIMFLSEISYLKLQSQVKAKCVSKVALQEA
ncbi:uncharacterized protein LOC117695473 [Arvicanthis niloticus]|uniref:uncharacterized protein LOC117695471 n=1 Tax=Arvicanthis niloticus TaxID=61156 RepID=UPI00148700F9|nr:uncharacterized protein LOC117695471 [Arvicanthis niloticus]XP_034342254.1 uncharacterized protein LOC117695473 [Arvicanthis niloticus]